MSYTPGPWRRGSDELRSPELFSEIYAPNGYLIAVCQTAHTRGKDQRDSVDAARANAERIVQCVNAHDDLLAACRKALGVLAGEDMNKQALIEALTMCRAAIAATQEQSK